MFRYLCMSFSRTLSSRPYKNFWTLLLLFFSFQSGSRVNLRQSFYIFTGPSAAAMVISENGMAVLLLNLKAGCWLAGCCRYSSYFLVSPMPHNTSVGFFLTGCRRSSLIIEFSPKLYCQFGKTGKEVISTQPIFFASFFIAYMFKSMSF